MLLMADRNTPFCIDAVTNLVILHCFKCSLVQLLNFHKYLRGKKKKAVDPACLARALWLAEEMLCMQLFSV